MEAPSWSQLPQEILDLILQRLPLPDCLTFGKVCPSWRSVFTARRRLTRPPPCMVLPHPRSTDPVRLCGLHGGKLLKFRSPVLNLHPNERIVGSSMGWLVIVYCPFLSLTHSLHMLNPVTNERIPLPSFCGAIYHVAASAAPMSDDCVLVLCGCVNDYRKCFRWCRPDGSDWTVMDVDFYSEGEITFHNDKLYIIDKEGDFHIYTFVPQPKKVGTGSFANISKKGNWYAKQMVQCGADLFLVVWPQLKSLDEDECVLEVFKQSEDQARWVRVENLGGQVLLISEMCTYGAQSFCTQDLLGSNFEPNCIYYPELGVKLMKFSVEDGSSQMIHIPDSQDNPCYSDVQWIVPQAWITLGSSGDCILPQRPSFWIAPPVDFVKVNFEAGSSKDSATYGIVVRNHLGHVAMCKFGRRSATDALSAEGSALLLGMELALLLNFSKVVFECHDEHLIALLMFDEAQPPQNAIEIIKSCKELAAKFKDCSFDYICREGNEAACGLNLLAQSDDWAYGDTDVTCLLAPDAISDVICAELLNM